jgi:vacuolar-type H+-ATPase subunit E/Vma4
MALEHILQALEVEAGQQIGAIEQAAETQVQQILSQAKVEAGVVRQKHLTAGRVLLQVERTRLLNRAKQQGSQMVLRARESLISSALTATEECLAALTDTDSYPRLLRQLAQEAVDTLGTDEPLCLHVSEHDVEVMEQIVSQMGFSATVTGDLKAVTSQEQTPLSPIGHDGQLLGGLAVTVAGGRVTLNNTLAARLLRASTLHRAQIAEIILAETGEREG